MGQETKQVVAYDLRSFNRAITSDDTQKYLQQVLGERKGSFVNNLTALVANNANLQRCEPYTVMFAAMKATALDLPLDGSLSFAHVIPYNNKKKGITEAQFQIGWRGLKQLALRTGQYKAINTTDVREGELVRRNRLTGEMEFSFIEDDKKRLETPVIGYVSYFRLHNGYESTFYMSKEEVEKHAKRYSETYRSKEDWVVQSSRWTTDFDAMAMKTVTKLNLSKNGVMSVEMRDAIKADQSIIRADGVYDYTDNPQQSEIDAEKAQDVAKKFADFSEEE